MQLPDAAIPLSAAKAGMMIERPATHDGDETVREIMDRGNIPLLIGNNILAEVPNYELSIGLAATEDLSASELRNIGTGLAESISDALMIDCAACDVTEVAADAAALFAVCLRRNNLLDVDNIPACSVSFPDQDRQAQLILAG